MKYLEKEEDLKEILKKDLVLIDFYADWCGPCRLMSKELELLETEEKDLEIVKVNVDDFSDLATKHSIMSIPTLEIYKKGKKENKYIGYLTKEEIKDLLR